MTDVIHANAASYVHVLSQVQIVAPIVSLFFGPVSHISSPQTAGKGASSLHYKG